MVPCYPGARSRALLPMLLVTGALTVAPLIKAATPELVVADPLGITAFDLYENGLIWWDAPGRCTGEMPHEATVRVMATLGGGTVNLARDCAMLEGDYTRVVRDEAYIYFFSGLQLHRKALNALERDPSQVLVTTNLNPTLPAAQSCAVLELAESQLYWPRRGSSYTTIYRMPSDGSSAPDQLVRITNTNDVSKLQRFILTDPDAGSAESLAVLFSDGRLYRVLLTSPTATLYLAGGVADFAVHRRRLLTGTTTYLYAAIGKSASDMQPETPAGGLLRINAYTGDATTIYTASGNNQVLSVAVDPSEFVTPIGSDPHYLYLAEAIMSCGELFCDETDRVIKRHTTPGSTTGWEQIVTTGGGGNLRLDKDWLYYVAGNMIRRISRDAPAQELDFVADGLEVTQAIQNLDISVPLVSRHPTFARGYAYVRTNTAGGSWQPDAHLYGYLNDQLLPGSPIEPVNRPTLESFKSLPQRRILNTSFSYLFELPDTWMDYGDPLVPARLQLKMVVNEDLDVAETGVEPLANNVVWLRNPATVIGKGRPGLTFIPLITPGPTCGFEDVPDLAERARSLMPVADWMISEFPAPFGDPEDPYAIGSEDPDTDDAEQTRALDDLEDFSWFPCGDWGDQHYVGMLHESTPNFAGVTRRNQAMAIVHMDPDSYKSISHGGGAILAHELGHGYGRQHVNCGNFPADQQNFDLVLYTCSLGVPDDVSPDAYVGWDYLESGIIAPESAADIMSYASSLWPSHVYWNALLERTARAPVGAGSGDDPQPGGGTGNVLLLQGRLGRSEPSGFFRPLYALPEDLLPADRLAQARELAASLAKDASAALLRQLDARGTLLSEIPIAVSEAHSEEVRRLHFDTFSQWVDLAPDVRTLQLLRNNQVWIERFVSPHPPILTISTVNVDQAAQSVYVRWKAEDPDGDPLRFLVQYGAGSRWFTIRKNYRGLEDTIDARGLPGSSETRVRIIATDGVQTAVATSEPFAMSNQPPRPTLSGVKERQRLPFGETRVLRGHAFDPETGTSSNTLALSLTGPSPSTQTGLVAALSLPLQSLSPGAYTATLDATDPAGQTARVTRQFDILPITIPDGSAPTLDGLSNDNGYTNAPLVRVVWAAQDTIPVRLLHSGSNLFVSFSNLKYGGVRASRQVGLRVEVDGNGSSTPSIKDRGFFVDEDGIPSQEVGTGLSGMAVTTTPSAGFSAIVHRSSNTWNAEFRVTQSLLNGWNHAARIMLVHDSAEWPPTATSTSPASWAPVYFGTNPPSPVNRAPVAHAGESQRIRLRAPRNVYLNGSGSTDGDRQSLLFAWKQTTGPVVQLLNPASPTPCFLARPVGAPATLTFQLVVSDGALESAPAETAVTLLPAALRPPDVAPRANAQLRADGVLQLRLTGEPGQLYRLEISTDLEHWQLLRHAYADELGLLDLTEAVDFGQHQTLFYRLVGP